MLSLREAVNAIDGSVEQQAAKIQSLDGSIGNLQNDITRLRRADLDDFRALARMKLGSIAGKGMIDRLDEAERRALELAERRDTTRKEVDRTLATIATKLNELAQMRAAQSEAAEEAAAAVETAEAATLARLNQSSGYAERLAHAKELERMALHAAEKATQSEQEEDHKGQAYRSDPLFMYLWNREYGLPAYAASNLVRWLDGKVARLIGYDAARANYARLHELPIRLRAHANRMEADADAEVAAVQALYMDARKQDGIDALDAELALAKQKLDQIDQEIQETEASQQEQANRKGSLDRGEGDEAVDYLAREYSQGDLLQLLKETILTPFPEDDAIVGRIIRRQWERQGMEAAVDEFKQTLTASAKRLAELREVRDRFRKQRAEGWGSSLAQRELIATILEQFLDGAVSQSVLFDAIDRQQRQNLKSARGDDWGPWGTRHKRKDLSDMFRGGFGGHGGGGFSTGGGFGGGGGGFGTGGGF